MPTIESYIRTYFVYNDGVRRSFEDTVEIFDRDDDVMCFENSADSVSFRAGSIRGELRFRPSDGHLYSCGTDFVEVVVSCERFASSSGEKAFEAFLELVTNIYEQTDPQYVFGMHSWRIEKIDSPSLPQEYRIPSPVSDQGLASGRIDLPTWLMLFTPPMVEEYGRTWLLDIPVDRNEELDDGSILTIATEDIVNPEPVDRPWVDEALAEMVSESMKPLEPLFED